MTNLTAEQIQMIKETWEVPKKDLEGSGEAILYRYFEKYPHNQQKFASFKALPLESLKGSKGFRAHALRVVTVFQVAIDAFDSDDVVGNLLKIWEPIGASHSRRRIPKESFNELRDAVLEIMIAACSLTAEQQEAWVILFENIYAIVFAKMDESSN